MAWDLDGVNQYLDCAMPAAVKSAPGGPLTLIAFVELDASTDGGIICNMSGSTVFQFMEIFSSFNYGTSAGTRTGPVATAQTPSAVGTPYIVIISKNTGNVAPEYTLIPWVSGAPGTPVTGTITGGGVTLGDGVAAGASGFIRIGRWGTSGTEYVNGRVIALAQHLSFKDATARALFVSWAAFQSGAAWAMEFTALTSRIDATGNGGDETGRFGTASITLAADPANFFSSGTTAADASPPAAMRWRSAYETVVSDGISADTSTPGALRWRSRSLDSGDVSIVTATDSPAALRWRSSLTESGVVSVVAADGSVTGLRWRSSLTESALANLVVADTSYLGFRWRESLSSGETATVGLDASLLGMRWRSRAIDGAVADVVGVDTAPLGWRFRESPASGESATIGTDASILGLRWRSRPVDGASTDVTGVDTQPLGWRFRSSVTSGSASVVGTDTPNGLRWRSGADGSIVNPPDVGTDVVGYDTVLLGWRWRESVASGYAGSSVTEEPDFYSVVAIERFSSSVAIDRIASVVVADRL